MNKSLIALAALAAISHAHADVEVAAGLKLYGVFDQGLMRQSVASASSTVRAYSNTGFFAAASTSRFGVKGERDVGNGYKGMVQFEQEITPDESTLMPAKNRTAFVGLANETAGTLLLGTQETPAYVLFGSDANGRAEYKPQLWRYLAGSATQDRANNAFKYTSPKFGPLTVDLMRAYGETNVGNTSGTAQTGDFKSWGVNYSAGPLQAKLVWDSITNTELKYALPGEINAGVLSYSSTATSNVTTQYKTKMIASSASSPLQRQFLGASYDFGAAKVNYIMANASTSGKGEVKTNTVGIRIPMDKITLALSVGSGTYSDAAAYSGVAKIAGNLEDTTFGAYYNFDKSTAAYFLSSRSKNTVIQSTGDTDHTAGTVGKSNTSTLGLRYNY